MSTPVSDQLATRSEDLVQSIGINTHVSDVTTSYGDLQAIVSQLNYLGLDKARDVIPGAALRSYQLLAAEGIRFSLEYPSLAMSHADLLTFVATMDQLGKGVLQVEGPNEPNVVGVTYEGMSGAAGANALQAALYAAVHNDPILNNATQTTPVLASGLAPGAVFSLYGNLSAYSDFTNAHYYARYGSPPYWSMQIELNAITNTPGKPLQITETGQFTVLDHSSGVSESVQAKWDIDTLLEGFQLGSSGTFLYQLQDAIPDPNSTNIEFHYGLFHADGTPKLAAIAVHNLTTILHDGSPQAGSFIPDHLAYSVTGLPYYGLHNLTEKASGTFDLALWAEPNIWNSQTDTAIYVAPSNVTVTFGQIEATINVYDVLTGTTPIATYHNVSQIAVSLGSDPLIVEIVPVDPVAPATVVLAQGMTTVSGHVVAQAGSGTYAVTVNDAETITGGSGSLTVSLNGAGASVAGGSGTLAVTDIAGGNTITGGSGGLSVNAAAGDDWITTGTSASNMVTLGSGKTNLTALGATTVTGGSGVANVTLSGGGNVVAGGSGILMVSDLVGSNTVTGGSGAFGITASVGNDVITTGTSLENSVALGAGQDTVTAVGRVTVTGGSGVAMVTLNSSNSIIDAHAGTMTIVDHSGSNILFGGTGIFDLTDIVGNDWIRTGASGQSHLTLGAGPDTITALGATTVTGGAGAATVTLSSAGNSVTGGTGALSVTDSAGGNTINGGTGAFSVTAMAGADVISTNNTTGISSVALGTGVDTVTANGATNIIASRSALTVTGQGDVSVNGGLGSITLALTGSLGNEYIFTQAGTQNLLALGNGKNAVLSHGADTIRAGAGKSTIMASGSSVMVYGGKGTLGLAATAVTATYLGSTGTAVITGGAGTLKATLNSVGNRITGGAGALTVTDGGSGNTITGGAGTLTLLAFAGGDAIATNNKAGLSSVVLGSGADTVTANGATTIANVSAKLLVIGNGTLSINGGMGSLTLTGNVGDESVFTQAGTQNLLNLGSGKNSVLSHGADTINASTASGASSTYVYAAGPDLITGGAGLLSVNGRGAAVTVLGGTGAVKATAIGDNSYLKGGSLGGNVLSAAGGNTTLVGGGSGDTLTDTGSGNNLLVASAGTTTLTAGSGNDTLVGGAGADMFVFTHASTAHAEMVQNFKVGTDHVSFAGFGATTPIASQQVVGGNLQLTLADQTQVTLTGVTSLS